MATPAHMIDFPTMKQVNIYDSKKQRPVKRGKQGERSVRPSDEKFMDNSNFLVGEFNPLCDPNNKSESGSYLGGGRWLGSEFYKSIGKKCFPV